jgi:hypothetical protein
VQLGRRTVARLLHERLGWSVQQASHAAADGGADEPARSEPGAEDAANRRSTASSAARSGAARSGQG